MKVKTLLIAIESYAAFPMPLTRLLKKSGFRLIFAKDVDRVLALYTTQTIDLILLDLFLPPYGAYAIVQSLRSLDACVPIMLIGPSAAACETYRTQKNIFAGCITLSESDDSILRAIRNCLWRNISYSLDEVTQLIESAEQPMTLTDASGSIHFTNPSFSELSGFYLDEVVGENPRLWNSGAQPQSFYESMWRTIQSGTPWTGSVRNRKKNGSLYSAQMFIKPLQGLYETIPRGFLAIHTELS